MKSAHLEELDKYLRSFKYKCYSFSVETLGEYLPIDAEWNYKDIPHLNHIHGLVHSGITFAGDHIATSILVQEIMPFLRIPMTLVNYHVSSKKIIYHSQFLFWIIIIETNFEYRNEIERTGSRTITKYNLYGPRIFRWLCPLFKFFIKRNNQNLMQDDVPMRERRQTLRKAGYDFLVSKKDYHSYSDTLKLGDSNLIEPDLTGLIGTFELSDVPVGTRGLLVGDAIGRGFRVVKLQETNVLLVFERVCEHYGADLSNAKLDQKMLMCPWHGNRLRPIAQIHLAENNSVQGQRKNFEIKIDGQTVSIFKTKGGSSDKESEG